MSLFWFRVGSWADAWHRTGAGQVQGSFQVGLVLFQDRF